MLIDADDKFISLRSHSRMALIQPFYKDEGMVLDVGGELVPATLSEERTFAILKSDVIDVRIASHDVNAKLTSFLGEEIRLVFMDEESRRIVDPDFGNGEVNLADNSPISIINTASLRALSDLVGYRIDVEQFRPNFVIQSNIPWVEDGWRTLRVGDAIFELVRPISRCKIITLHPQTGQTLGPKIMKSLIESRKSGDSRVKGVLFGWAAIPRNSAEIRAGSTAVISKSAEPWSLQ